MEFKLNIELGNAAMDTAGDVARALEAVAHKLRHEDCIDCTGSIRDENGNRVGSWKVQDA